MLNIFYNVVDILFLIELAGVVYVEACDCLLGCKMLFSVIYNCLKIFCPHFSMRIQGLRLQ